MDYLHAKSSCCAAPIRRFGGKRRQCKKCLRTWRIRPKRRGRPQRRPAWNLLRHILLRGHRLNSRARFSSQTSSAQFRNTVQRFLQNPWPTQVPEGPLVLISDGVWFRFQKKPWVLYVMAIKPCHHDRAWLLDPVLLPGRESPPAWRQVLDTLPTGIRGNIQGWVTDNVAGFPGIAAEKKWVLQLCQFHLISSLQRRRGTNRAHPERHLFKETAYQLVRELLKPSATPDLLIDQLRTIQKNGGLSWRHKTILGGFIRKLNHYRSYKLYPELGLPATTSAIESLGSRLRDMLRRARNLRTPESLLCWCTAFIRLQKTITCRAKKSTN